MTQEQTIEGNKLITEFMGIKPNPQNGVYPIECPHEGSGWHLETMKYAGSWDWLMPAWKKIKSDLSDNNMLYMSLLSAISDVNIDKAFNLMVEAVKWYNQQQKL